MKTNATVYERINTVLTHPNESKTRENMNKIAKIVQVVATAALGVTGLLAAAHTVGLLILGPLGVKYAFKLCLDAAFAVFYHDLFQVASKAESLSSPTLFDTAKKETSKLLSSDSTQLEQFAEEITENTLTKDWTRPLLKKGLNMQFPDLPKIKA